jgi:long-chain acyl-CoA synthetase
MLIVSEILAGTAKRYPDRTFVDDGTQSLTYGEFERQACRLAHVLVTHGARVGEPFAIYVPSSIEVVLAYHACQRMGAIAIPISAMNKQRELEGIARRTDVGLMLTGSAGRDVALDVAATVDTLTTILDFDGPSPSTVDVREQMSKAKDDFDLVDRHHEDVATVFFTSGTTGKRRGSRRAGRRADRTVPRGTRRLQGPPQGGLRRRAAPGPVRQSPQARAPRYGSRCVTPRPYHPEGQTT